MAKNRFNQSWLHDHINDPYVKMAQREGYRARAAYKLKEIDEQDKLIRPGQVIVDLGSSPGSWSQYARNKLASGAQRNAEREGGIDGTIIALDILPMEPVADVHFIQGDFREEPVLAQLEELVGARQVDLVISDMAPNFSGIDDVDQSRSMLLSELAFDFALKILPKNGCFLIKVFQGEGFEAFLKSIRIHFKKVVIRKPKASRERSREIYLVAQGRK